MKKCPTCDKEFPDSMRFCQVDGTPLVEAAAAAPPDDPYKTTVGRQEDIKAAIPPVDPFATMVNTSFKKEDSGDLLQLPDEKNDPLKTMYASESEIRGEMEKIKPSEQVFDVPPIAAEKEAAASEPAFAPPAPPIFNEPNITPPTFGDSPLSEQKTAIVSNSFNEPPNPEQDKSGFDNASQKTEVISNPFSEPPKQEFPSPFEQKTSNSFDEKPASPFDPKPNNTFDNSPFGNSGNTGPIPSPFDASMPPAYQAPSAPLPQYKEPEKTPSLPKYEEPSVNQPFNNPFDNQPPAGQSAMTNEQESQNQGWNPPPAPDPNWQNQPVGQNTPFQPPVTSQGASKTLAVSSLICGLVSLLSLVCSIIPFIGIICGLLSFGLAVAAIITGFLARSRAAKNPAQYQGAGLALGGIITGFLTILGIIGLVIVGVILGVAMSSGQFR